MSEKNSDKLLHVQNGAIRQLLYSRVEDQELINRYRQVTKREIKKDLQEALSRLDKEALIAVVDISPELTADEIELCFEDNRYSRRPNFRLSC